MNSFVINSDRIKKKHDKKHCCYLFDDVRTVTMKEPIKLNILKKLSLKKKSGNMDITLPYTHLCYFSTLQRV